MDPITLILLTLQSLAVVTQNPALGGGSSLKLNEVSNLLNLLATFVLAGKAGEEHLQAFADTVAKMRDEHRAPTPNEWADLTARRDAAHQRLQDLKPELEAQAAAEEAAKKAAEDEKKSKKSKKAEPSTQDQTPQE
jgi:hypothetical protein